MVAELLKLRLRILGNSFIRTPRQNVGVVLVFLLCVAAAALAISSLVALIDAPLEVVRNSIIIGGSLLTIAFLIVPLISGVPDTLDPRRFAILGIPRRQLSIGVAVAGLLTVPSILLIAVALTTVVTWGSVSSVGTAIVGAFTALCGIAICVLGSRITSLLAGLVLATKRARETTGVLVVFAVLLLVPAAVLWTNGNGGWGSPLVISNLADALGWGPFGAVWSIPADLAAGASAGVIVLKFLIAVATLVVLWLIWSGLVGLISSRIQRESTVAETARLGWFGRTPSTRSGAIAARSFTYWARDSRYSVPVVGVFIFLIVAYLTFLVVGIPLTVLILLTVPALCITLAFSVHNDVSLDNTAVWLHVVSGRVGVADRLGRTAPVLVIGIPLIGIGSVLAAFAAGNFDYLPGLLGISTCLLLAGLGVGNFFSALFPYAAVRPGDSPFAQPQGGSGTGTMVQIAFVIVTFGLTGPAIVFGIQALLGDPGSYWLSLWWGVGLGVLSLVAGTIAGGRLFDLRGPEILATALRN